MTTDQKKAQAFIEEMNKLAQEHGLRVGGCGCCGSPYLVDAESDGYYVVDANGCDLTWVSSP